MHCTVTKTCKWYVNSYEEIEGTEIRVKVVKWHVANKYIQPLNWCIRIYTYIIYMYIYVCIVVMMISMEKRYTTHIIIQICKSLCSAIWQHYMDQSWAFNDQVKIERPNGEMQDKVVDIQTVQQFLRLLHAYSYEVCNDTIKILWHSLCRKKSQITRFTWPTWGRPGSCRPQVGPMLAPWTLLSYNESYTRVSVARRHQMLYIASLILKVQYPNFLWWLVLSALRMGSPTAGRHRTYLTISQQLDMVIVWWSLRTCHYWIPNSPFCGDSLPQTLSI